MDKTFELKFSLRALARYFFAFIGGMMLVIAAGRAFATAPNPGHNFTEVGGGAAQGDILYGSAADTLAALAKNTTASRYLSNSGASNNPAWAQVDLTTGVTGILPTANGGTNVNSSAFSGTAFITAGVWSATSTLALNNGGTGAALAANTGGIAYSAASGLAILAGTATANKILLSGATAAPTWSTPTFPGSASATSRKVIVSDGTNWVASTETYAVPGSLGNKLASDGTNWIAASGRILIGVQVKVAGNTTYVPTAGTNAVLIRMCAGGGGGGGVTAGAANAMVGGGGGSGSYLEKFVTFSTTAASYVIAVGAAGTAGPAAGTVAGSGGVTTFACDANCSSGAVTFGTSGGAGAPAANAAGTTVIASLGGAGGAIATNGDLNETGQPGQPAQRFSATAGISGNGAPSHFGGGGNAVNAIAASATIGTTAGGNCAGGGGAVGASNTTAETGGVGGAGVMDIWEFR